ncbi:MAG TPA: winged helix DNA-binding domain-containing protein [Steroidobacteraceae bacterium]|nr:winged helix DNA-binding domain-containing protein [Steroidobacteraceae bacterium]
MTPRDILRLRLDNHRLARASFRKPEDVVAWFGAVQAQDYLGSLWAIGLRMQRATEALVEEAETRRAIVRTWPMRGTLHFVAAADARWMTRLLAPRVIARNAARLKREVNVDTSVTGRSREIVARALEGGRRLDRGALYEALEARKIRTGASRGLHILLWLALEGTICLAGRQGKQHTFALLDEWIPKSADLDRDEALAELARRYFTSHGPATVQDFMWWAGITARDAAAALEGARQHLARQVIEGRAYWLGARRVSVRGAGTQRPAAFVKLLPAFDEYTVAYRDRSLLVGPGKRVGAGSGLLNPVVVVDGRAVGTWKRTFARGSVQLEMNLPTALDRRNADALRDEADRFRKFLGIESSGTGLNASRRSSPSRSRARAG